MLFFFDFFDHTDKQVVGILSFYRRRAISIGIIENQIIVIYYKIITFAIENFALQRRETFFNASFFIQKKTGGVFYATRFFVLLFCGFVDFIAFVRLFVRFLKAFRKKNFQRRVYTATSR